MADTVRFCVMDAKCEGPSHLVDTCYGFTGGDKWRCEKCGSYAVLLSQSWPSRPSGRSEGGNHA